MSVTCFKYKQLLLPIYVLLLAVSYSCTGNNRPVAEWQLLPVPADSAVHYFDTDEKDSLPGAFNPMVNTWFSEMLLALKEPVLKDYRGSRAICRLTLLRTRHHPVTVRVEEEGNRAMLFCKVTDGMGGYLPGKIITDTSLPLSVVQVAGIRNKLQAAAFNSLPTHEPADGKDGAEWIVELYEKGKYHVVVRWCPPEQTPFRAIGEYLLALAPLIAETVEELNY